MQILVDYSADIHNSDMTVAFSPSNSGVRALSRVSPVSHSFTATPSNNELAYFYDESTYENSKTIRALSSAVAALALIVFGVGMFAGKLIGVEMMAVIQVSFLSLLNVSEMNPCFKALSGALFVNGLNLFSFSKDHLLDPFTPIPVKGVGLYSRFL